MRSILSIYTSVFADFCTGIHYLCGPFLFGTYHIGRLLIDYQKMADTITAIEYKPEICASFAFPSKGFRMRCDSQTQIGANGTIRFFKSWIYEVDLSVNEKRQYTEMPTGKWTVTLRKVAYIIDPSVQFEVMETTVSLSPHASTLAELTAVSSQGPIKVDFTVRNGVSKATSAMCRGTGIFRDDLWHCPPVRSAVSTVEFLSNDNWIKPEIVWSIDLKFSIDWTVRRTIHQFAGLADKLSGAYNSTDFTDCTLVAADGREFHVHRVILASQSPVFAAMFGSDMLEKSTGICTVRDIDGRVLDIVLGFLYGRVVGDDLKGNVERVLSVADQYDLDDLRTVCEELMVTGLTKENAVRYLGLSTSFGLVKLMKEAAKIVVQC